MVKRLLKLFNKEISGLHEAAYLLAFFALLSQILALFRDRLLAGSFGAGEILDVYYAAFRIPDAIFITVASLVSASIIIPIIFEKLGKGDLEAKRFTSLIFSAFSILLIVFSAIAYMLAPILVAKAFPGFNGTNAEVKILLLTRIMLLQPILLGISNFFAGITQTYSKFFVYALSPLFYNAGIILGAVYFYPTFGISGLAWGVVLGAGLHLAIQLPALLGTGIAPNFTLKIDWYEVWQVAKISLPRTIGLAANNLSTFALVSLGSIIGVGSISVFTLSWNLQSVPLSIIGASYSMAAFPTLSKLFIAGKNSEYLDSVRSAMKHIIFWSMPALVLFVVLRAQIVRVVLGFGQFDWSDTRLTAASLALFSVSVVAQGAIVLLSRAYYASGKTAKPLISNVSGAIIAVALSAVFVKIIHSNEIFRYFIESLLKVDSLKGTAVLMLPLGYSLATILNLILLWYLFKKDFPNWDFGLVRTIFENVGSSVVGGFVAFLGLNIFDNIFPLEKVYGVFFQGFCAGILGILGMVLVLLVVRSPELKEVSTTLRHKVWKVIPIGPDTTENPTL
jgi:putative peptidoglycan lipid II flippase